MAMKRTLAASLILMLAVLSVTIAVQPAQADDPVDITGQITDRADVLGADRADVRRALDRFFDRTGLQLFVVYVPTFGDLRGPEWAARTAERSGLGQGDVLLAVATKDRAYGYSTDNETFTADDLASVDRGRILPALRNDDFAAAAIEAADGYGDIAEDEGLAWGGFVLAGVLVLVAGAFIVHRVRQRFDHTHRVLDEHGNPVDPATILTSEELDAAASRALVAIDDALKTSEQELGYAEAQFGAQATQTFRTTLERGREVVREAFTLRQRLDDVTEETEMERRKEASRIITICEEVDAELDAQVESFDKLRDLQTRAPQVLDELATRADEVSGRLPDSRSTLERLPPGAIVSVRDDADQAEQLIATAREQIAQGRDDIDDRPAAAMRARAAEDAIAQAITLLDAIDEAAAGAAGAADALGRVTSKVKGVGEFIETRRGAVGAQARTRLSGAARHLDRAQRTMADDQDAARADLDTADRLADEAQILADGDVIEWTKRRQNRDVVWKPGFESMVLGGILVDARKRGGLGSVLGGSSHGGGSGTPYRGSQTGTPRTPRTPGSFGGTSKRGRRSGGGRF
ncbi:TPM domain-containing protein [Aeromicrobium sp.]|uniref:TPM domain-containing protein n=1 Tax=Aeromicrobium sp. TaxID=1871063 RepID=UPI003D6BFF8F